MSAPDAFSFKLPPVLDHRIGRLKFIRDGRCKAHAVVGQHHKSAPLHPLVDFLGGTGKPGCVMAAEKLQPRQERFLVKGIVLAGLRDKKQRRLKENFQIQRIASETV